jgi:hypothetical protein
VRGSEVDFRLADRVGDSGWQGMDGHGPSILVRVKNNRRSLESIPISSRADRTRPR